MPGPPGPAPSQPPSFCSGSSSSQPLPLLPSADLDFRIWGAVASTSQQSVGCAVPPACSSGPGLAPWRWGRLTGLGTSVPPPLLTAQRQPAGAVSLQCEDHPCLCGPSWVSGWCLLGCRVPADSAVAPSRACLPSHGASSWLSLSLSVALSVQRPWPLHLGLS